MSLTHRIQSSHAQSFSLLSSLSSTYSDYTAHPHARDHVLALQSRLKAMDRPLAQLRFTTEAERKDVEKLDKSHVRKGFSKFAHRDEKWATNKDKEEREFKEAWQKEDDMKSQQEKLKEELRSTELERDRSEAVWRAHGEKQAELDNLYNSIFGGPTPEFPEHEHARANFDAASTAYNDAARLADIASRVVKCLVDAANCFAQAHRELADAKDMSSMDLFGGGAGISAIKREDMNRAQRSLMMAERCVFEAHTLAPEVRSMNQFHVGPQGSGFTDIMFDNVFTDMRVGDEVKSSIAKLQKEEEMNRMQVQEGQQRLQGRKNEIAHAQGRRDDARWELQRVRADIIERVANGGGVDNYGSSEYSKPPLAY